MPGMMSTVLNVGLTAEATAGLAAETGDPRFALDARLRFLSGFASTVVGLSQEGLEAVAREVGGRDGAETPLVDAIRGVEALVRQRACEPVPGDARRQLELAVASSTAARRCSGSLRGTSTTLARPAWSRPADSTCSPGGWARARVSRPAGWPPPPTRRSGWRPVARSSWCPETSPLDMHGLAAAAGIVTARGGPAGHAAVVARAMGKPAVVGAADLTIEVASVRAGGRTLPEGTLITIDGTGGEVVVGRCRVATAAGDAHLHRLLAWADDVAGGDAGREEVERLRAAHAALLDA
jgi:phosphohistidine swiveling domain-containing protein